MKNIIKHRIKYIVSKQLGINKKDILNDFHFTEDMGADSLDIVELIMALEKEFNIEIPDKIIEKITTINTAANYISRIIES